MSSRVTNTLTQKLINSIKITKSKIRNMRSTYNIKAEKKLKLERAAIDLSVKLGKQIKWTEIMETLIDEFYKDACDVLLIRYEQEAQLEAEMNSLERDTTR